MPIDRRSAFSASLPALAVLVAAWLLLFQIPAAFVNAGAGGAASFAQPRELSQAEAERIGRNLPRVAQELARAADGRSAELRVLFYGQSIVAQPWWQDVVAGMDEAWPGVRITAGNLAIGGFEAPALLRVAVHDVEDFAPDLIIFHVYGGHGGELESLVRLFRFRTSADVVILTSHVAIGSRNAEGSERAASLIRAHDEHADLLTRLGDRYGCEVIPIRRLWKKYLQEHELPASALLSDGIHLNEHGRFLMARLVGRHLKQVSGSESGEGPRVIEDGDGGAMIMPQVERIEVGQSVTADRPLRMRVTGTRIEVVPGHVDGKALGSARIMLDGRPPSQQGRLYGVSRPSRARDVWWPAIRRIDHEAPLVPELWQLRVTEVAPDARWFGFEVTGGLTGFDGRGRSDQLFLSQSKRVVIAPEDFMMLQAARYRQSTLPPGFIVQWQVTPRFVDVYDQPESSRLEVGGPPVPIVWGLPLREHLLEIIPNGDGPVVIDHIRVHQPMRPAR